MSQDSEVWAKCGRPCGYDDDKAYFDPGVICGQCKHNLQMRFYAFFGMDGSSYDFYGLDVSWRDVDRILAKIKRDYAMRVTCLVTNKELYERKVDILTPICEEGNNVNDHLPKISNHIICSDSKAG